MATPNPSILAGRTTLAQTVNVVLAVTEPEPVDERNVVKAKAVRKGMVVRAWLHDAPRGSEYTIEDAVQSEDGATVHITFEKPCQRPDGDYKAAYRFYVVSGGDTAEPAKPARKPRKAGKPTRRPLPSEQEHLTYHPFASLATLKETL